MDEIKPVELKPGVTLGSTKALEWRKRPGELSPTARIQQVAEKFESLRLNLGTVLGAVFSEYPKVDKVWGQERILCNTSNYCCKLMTVKPRMRCSLHRHFLKNETFIVLDGTLNLEYATTRRNLAVMRMVQGERKDLPTMTWHRFENPSYDDVAVILEISQHHEDSDVEREEESGAIP